MNRKKAEEILSKHITLGLSQACQVIDAMLEFASLNRERVKEVLINTFEDFYAEYEPAFTETDKKFLRDDWNTVADSFIRDLFNDLCEPEEQPTDDEIEGWAIETTPSGPYADQVAYYKAEGAKAMRDGEIIKSDKK